MLDRSHNVAARRPGACECSGARIIRAAPRITRPAPRIVRAAPYVSAPVYQKPQRPREAAPVVVRGQNGAKCRPFLKVEKDAEKFAACNALAEQLGPIESPEQAFEVISEAIGDEVNEVFGVMTLDLHLRFKGLSETGRGEPSSTMAPIEPTLQVALIDGAHAAIIFHVHPSGVDAEPSDADVETTEAFVEAFDIVGPRLIDHMIIGGDAQSRSYYSFAEEGAL
jgi:DNA repair protein RadC